MNKEQIIKSLHEGVCEVSFTKVNGDKRVMTCTLLESMLPKKEATSEDKPARKQNENALAVFDVNANGWRSFRWDSVTDFKAGV